MKKLLGIFTVAVILVAFSACTTESVEETESQLALDAETEANTRNNQWSNRGN